MPPRCGEFGLHFHEPSREIEVHSSEFLTFHRGSMRAKTVISSFVLGAWVLLAGPVGAETAKEVQAVWKPQEFSFQFQSFNVFYSCESLEAKLEQILKQVGAQAVVRVRSPECGRGPARMPRADIQLLSPVEATPDALAELKQGESKRDLAARVAGKSAEAEELEKPFAAQWQRVNIGKSRAMPSLESGDCELVDQVRRKIFPKLAVRVVESNSPCPTNSPSLTRPTMVVDALTRIPQPDEADKK